MNRSQRVAMTTGRRRADLRGDLLTVADRFVAQLRGADPGASAVGSWAVGDVAAHVCSVVALNHAFLTGESQLGLEPVLDLARAANAQNHPDLTARAAAWVGTRDPAVLAPRIEHGIEAMVGAAVDIAEDAPRRWLGDVPVPVRSILGHMVSELLVHGRDIAGAHRRPWPVADEHARHFFEAFAVDFLPAATEHGFFARDDAPSGDVDWEIELRGSISAGFSYHRGELRMVPAGGRPVDLRISATPSAMLLVLYHRVNPLVPVLRRQVAVRGRRPWRVFRTMRALPAL